MKNTYGSITKEKIWIRNCPNCNKELIYKRKAHRDFFVKNNSLCNKCRGKIRVVDPPVGGWVRICKKCGNVKRYCQKSTFDRANKQNVKCYICLKQETKNKLIRNCPKCNKQLKYSSTRNFNRSIKSNCMCRSCNGRYTDKSGNVGYNTTACKFIDEYGKQHGYNFRHALNGGEIMIAGYFVDGYDKEKM